MPRSNGGYKAWYAARRAAGQCCYASSCGVMPENRRAYCPEHAMRQNALSKGYGSLEEIDEKCSAHGGTHSPKICSTCLEAERAARVETLRAEDFIGGLGSWPHVDRERDEDEKRNSASRKAEWVKRQIAKLGRKEFNRMRREQNKRWRDNTRVSRAMVFRMNTGGPA